MGNFGVNTSTQSNTCQVAVISLIKQHCNNPVIVSALATLNNITKPTVLFISLKRCSLLIEQDKTC